jgi:hypothetical protein
MWLEGSQTCREKVTDMVYAFCSKSGIYLNRLSCQQTLVPCKFLGGICKDYLAEDPYQIAANPPACQLAASNNDALQFVMGVCTPIDPYCRGLNFHDCLASKNSCIYDTVCRPPYTLSLNLQNNFQYVSLGLCMRLKTANYWGGSICMPIDENTVCNQVLNYQACMISVKNCIIKCHDYKVIGMINSINAIIWPYLPDCASK